MSDDSETTNIDGRDVPLTLLKPLNERKIGLTTHLGFRKIVASIKAVGLIEPLSVFKEEDDTYLILDGYLRYLACKELGVSTVPCILHHDKQAYSFNRNVNRLSGYQEIRMLRKSIETVPEATIARTFGIKSLGHRLATALVTQLHPQVVAAFKQDLRTKQCAMEFTFVAPERQAAMLTEMKRVADYSASFCRALVIQTPGTLRNRKKQQRRAWVADDQRKKDMVARLQQAEQQHDFYSNLYQQYSTDLLKTAIYVRKLILNSKVVAYLEQQHPDILTRLRQIVLEATPQKG